MYCALPETIKSLWGRMSLLTVRQSGSCHKLGSSVLRESCPGMFGIPTLTQWICICLHLQYDPIFSYCVYVTVKTEGGQWREGDGGRVRDGGWEGSADRFRWMIMGLPT